MKDAASSPREYVVQILRRHGPLGLAEIADYYGARAQSVRPQLSWLLANGYVEVETIRSGVGRPRHRYRLTARADEMFPKDYRDLAIELIESAATQGEVALVHGVFMRRESELESEISPQLLGRNLEEKLDVICTVLSQRGYMARYFRDEDAVGYVLEARNCPVSAVVEYTDMPCSCERDMIARLLAGDASVESTKRLPLDDELCSYSVRPASVSAPGR